MEKIKRRGKYEFNSKYDISKYVIDNNFLTNIELKKLYLELKKHMFIKYGIYDEDIIQLAVIRGMSNCHTYNEKKSSKIVWFQTILRNIYLQQHANKYKSKATIEYENSMVRIDEYDDRNIFDTLIIKDEEETDDERVANLSKELIENNDCFIYLKLRIKDISYITIQKDFNITNGQLSGLLIRERELLKAMINKKDKSLLSSINNRVKKTISKVKKKRYEGKVYELDKDGNRLRECIICYVKFTTLEIGNIKTCSTTCRDRRKKIQSDVSNKKAADIRRELKKKK